MRTLALVQRKHPLQTKILTIPVHQFFVLVATEILAVAQIKDAFQQIGFALPIRSQKDIQGRIKGKAQLIIVAPILYGQFF